MNILRKGIFVVIGVLVAVCHKFFTYYLSPLELPEFNYNQYWGAGDEYSYKENLTIKPFEIIFENKILDDLRQQLKREIDFLPANEGISFENGFNGKILKRVIKYWREEYLPNWKHRQDYFNKFKHFKTQIQGLDIHFIHEKAAENFNKSKKVYPLLILNGWPGSIREFYDIIPLLKNSINENDYGFEVVAPSLPGFGWSQAASKIGMGPAQMAIVLRNLMLRLGYEQFFVQGGDWGSVIASEMATIFPRNVRGYHSNMCIFMTLRANLKLMIAKIFPKYFIEEGFNDFYPSIIERFPLLIEETGYFHLQATKPDTIGAALSHNPFGLAAYILEKFSVATNPSFQKLSDGGLTKYYSMNTLIDNLMVYYLTNSITSSLRIYKEAFVGKHNIIEMSRVVSNVPYGCASFQYDIAQSFDWQIKDKYPNLVHHTYYRNIGHFPALQAPNILYKDIIIFIEKITEKENK